REEWSAARAPHRLRQGCPSPCPQEPSCRRGSTGRGRHSEKTDLWVGSRKVAPTLRRSSSKSLPAAGEEDRAPRCRRRPAPGPPPSSAAARPKGQRSQSRGCLAMLQRCLEAAVRTPLSPRPRWLLQRPPRSGPARRALPEPEEEEEQT